MDHPFHPFNFTLNYSAEKMHYYKKKRIIQFKNSKWNENSKIN